jgi:hypothetical protein
MSESFKSTLILASMLSRRATQGQLVEGSRLDLLPEGPAGPERFKIKAAETAKRRSLIGWLLKDRYEWRGYQSVELAAQQSLERFTLVALDDETPLGTITVVFDMGRRLGADDAFGAELAALRAQGERLCEFTKLAVDPTVASKRVLAALFHVAYIVAHKVRGYDRLVIEVNPRHRRYYERMLDLETLVPERLNRSVNAPAVLLSSSFQRCREHIERLGGATVDTGTERSIYPLFFSQAREQDIVMRIQRRIPREATLVD